jgi:hypothetical protein
MIDMKYDGLTIQEDEESRTVYFNIDEALSQKNPRNTFLNGQLFIEMVCDRIITKYFCKGITGSDNRRRTVFSDFLKSRDVNFFMKINLLKKLEIYKEGKLGKLIDKKIITSLKSIGAVRNAFQHNLQHGDALNSLTDGDKFVFACADQIGLSVYSKKGIEDLKKYFCLEVKALYSALLQINMLDK